MKRDITLRTGPRWITYFKPQSPAEQHDGAAGRAVLYSWRRSDHMEAVFNKDENLLVLIHITGSWFKLSSPFSLSLDKSSAAEVLLLTRVICGDSSEFWGQLFYSRVHWLPSACGWGAYLFPWSCKLRAFRWQVRSVRRAYRYEPTSNNMVRFPLLSVNEWECQGGCSGTLAVITTLSPCHSSWISLFSVLQFWIYHIWNLTIVPLGVWWS